MTAVPCYSFLSVWTRWSKDRRYFPAVLNISISTETTETPTPVNAIGSKSLDTTTQLPGPSKVSEMPRQPLYGFLWQITEEPAKCANAAVYTQPTFKDASCSPPSARPLTQQANQRIQIAHVVNNAKSRLHPIRKRRRHRKINRDHDGSYHHGAI